MIHHTQDRDAPLPNPAYRSLIANGSTATDPDAPLIPPTMEDIIVLNEMDKLQLAKKTLHKKSGFGDYQAKHGIGDEDVEIDEDDARASLARKRGFHSPTDVDESDDGADDGEQGITDDYTVLRGAGHVPPTGDLDLEGIEDDGRGLTGEEEDATQAAIDRKIDELIKLGNRDRLYPTPRRNSDHSPVVNAERSKSAAREIALNIAKYKTFCGKPEEAQRILDKIAENDGSIVTNTEEDEAYRQSAADYAARFHMRMLNNARVAAGMQPLGR